MEKVLKKNSDFILLLIHRNTNFITGCVSTCNVILHPGLNYKNITYLTYLGFK